jgi:hypothetical protein
VRQAGWSALWSRLANVSLKQQWCETGLAGAASGGMHGLQMDCATYNLTDRVARPFQLPYTEAVDNCDVFGSPFCNVTRLSGNPIPLKGFVLTWAVIRYHGLGYRRIEAQIPPFPTGIKSIRTPLLSLPRRPPPGAAGHHSRSQLCSGDLR